MLILRGTCQEKLIALKVNLTKLYTSKTGKQQRIDSNYHRNNILSQFSDIQFSDLWHELSRRSRIAV
jgi:hypothetical protein